MTKSKSILTSVAFCLFVVMAVLGLFAGCATSAVKGVMIEKGFVSAVKVGSTLDTSKLVVKVIREDNSTSVISKDAYEIVSMPDTSRLGKQDLKVKYIDNEKKEYYAETTISVYGDLLAIGVDESFNNTITLNSTFDKDSINVFAEYECDEEEGNYKKYLTSADFTMTEVDTSTEGSKVVTISYTEGEITKTASVTINVVLDTFTITAFEMPKNILLYQTNSLLKNAYTSTNSTGVKGFEVTGEMYKVGSYNKFYFQPTLKVMSEDSSKELTLFEMTAKVYLWNGSEYSELTGSSLNEMVAFDSVEHWFQFTPKANGKQFKIETFPVGDISEANVDIVKPLMFEFVVIDGYNVYNDADLSAIDNENMQGKWSELKKKWVSEGKANTSDLFNVTTSTFILHNIININKDSIPAGHFYTAKDVSGATDASIAEGSLKDSDAIDKDPYSFVYKRYVKVGGGDSNTLGDTFKLEGNYFTISVQDLPYIVRESGNIRKDTDGAITTHTTLFCIMANSPKNVADIENLVGEGKSYATFEEAEKAVSAKIEFNNTAFMGNSGKTEESIKSGGILMTKLDKAVSSFNNCLAQRWFISFFTQRDDANMAKDNFLAMTINKTNAFDNYNTIIYNWGGSVIIKESHLIGAGGPLMINDHVDEKADNGGSPSSVTIDDRSVFESYVVGSEGWFSTYAAANLLLTQLKAQNAVFTTGVDGVKKTFCDSADKVNLISASKAGSAQDATNTPINAKFTLTGADVNLELNKGDTYKTILDLVVISKMLSNETIKTAVKGYMTGKNIGRYKALKEMIAFASLPEANVPAEMKDAWTQMQPIKSNYDTAISDEETIALVQGGVSKGIVYVATNGMVCMPDGENSWAIAPNKELWEEANGILYAYVFGNIGAVLTISNYTAPTA